MRPLIPLFVFLGMLFGVVHHSGGDNVIPMAGAISTAPALTLEAIETTELPAVFRKLVPESLDELRTIEAYTTQLVPKLKECTVNLRVGQAQGSGVLVSADGLILSAAHVVSQPGRRVSVMMPNGDTYRGRVLGRNQMMDAAMVQLESERHDWPHCELANMDSIALGDWCIVLGHPGGFLKERGLVIRLGRIVEKSKRHLQSDCELVGGDSGGPIFDKRGRLIGISSRIGEQTMANIHVPISAFQDDWDRLLASEDFNSHSGAYLGVSGDPADQGVGLKITDVYPHTPAARAGLRVGDIVVTVDSKKVSGTEQLSKLLGEYPPGETVTLQILRQGKSQTIEVQLDLRLD